MDVLLTGAYGRIGSALRRHLTDRPAFDFTYLDVVPGEEPERTVVADVRDYDAIESAFDGKDAVVHLALTEEMGSVHTDVGWTNVLTDELRAITNVYAAAVNADVEQIVFASTNQVTRQHAFDHPDPPANYVDEAVPVRPDSQYSLAKIYGEAYGRFCAETHDRRVYALRFGWVQFGGADHPYAKSEAQVEAGVLERDSERYESLSQSAEWLSGRDAARMIQCCLQDESVEFEIFNVASDNTGSWFDISKAREMLGYEPQDDVTEWDGPPEDVGDDPE